TYSQGYKAGSFNANGNPSRALAAIPIKAEVETAYEIGFKTAQRWFRVDTSAFYYDYKDLNISLTVQNPQFPTLPATVIGNAPKGKIYGADLQVSVQPVEKFNVTVGGTYLHARYGRFLTASGVGIAPDPGNPANFVNVNQPKQDWTHIQMARAPNFSGNISGDYTFD